MYDHIMCIYSVWYIGFGSADQACWVIELLFGFGLGNLKPLTNLHTQKLEMIAYGEKKGVMNIPRVLH